MKHVAVGHEHLTTGQIQVTDLAELRVVIARQQTEVHAVAVTEIKQPKGLSGGLYPPRRVMDLSRIAIDDETRSPLPERAQRIR